MFKKVAITGHTAGIGKGLYDHFTSIGCEVLGFSLDNGYDINDVKIINEIIEQTKDCDLFINNAYATDKQLMISKSWHKQHYNYQHYILNISSVVALNITTNYLIQQLKMDESNVKAYQRYKQELNDYSDIINFSQSRCKAITIMPGLVDTDFIKLDMRAISVDDLVKIVTTSLDNIKDNYFISSVVIQNK